MKQFIILLYLIVLAHRDYGQIIRLNKDTSKFYGNVNYANENKDSIRNDTCAPKPDSPIIRSKRHKKHYAILLSPPLPFDLKSEYFILPSPYEYWDVLKGMRIPY